MTIFSRPLTKDEEEHLKKQASSRKFSAPIPLYPEQDKDNMPTEIKVKARRNPASVTSGTYEKVYTTFSGSAEEGYCKFRTDLDDCVEQTAINAALGKFNAVGHLLTGTPRSNWDTIQLEYEAPLTEENFQEALNKLGLTFCDARARRLQKRFMTKSLGRPHDMTVSSFSSRIDTMRRYFRYLPGTSAEPTDEEMRYILIDAQPEWMRNAMDQTNYDWEDLEAHSKTQLVQYLGRLSLIQVSLDKARNNQRGNQKNRNNGTKDAPHKRGNGAVTICGYCGKKCHTEAVCRKKKRDEKNGKNNGQKAGTGNAEDNAIEALTATLLEDFGLDEEVSYDLAISLHESTTTQPNYVDHTSLSDLLTEVIVYVKHKNSSGEELAQKLYRVLVDTGCSRSLVKLAKLPEGLFQDKRQVKETIWKTNAGMYTTKYEVPLNFTLPEFAPSKEIEFTLAVDDTEKSSKYDMIIGRDLLQALGMDILFSTGRLSWDGITVPMKSSERLTNILRESMEAPLDDHEEDYCGLVEEDFLIHLEGEHSRDATSRAQRMLDAKYEKGDVEKTVDTTCEHLSAKEKEQLKILLHRYEILFDGTLGKWNTKPVELEVKPESPPFHGKAYPVPQVHEATLKKEVQRLEKLGVLKRCADSEWAAPTFIIPKKDGTVRFISDFRKLNLALRRKPFPIPNIQDVLQKLGGFTYATSLDLNMGYYTLSLSPESQKLCTISTPLGKVPMSTATNGRSWQSRHFPGQNVNPDG